MCDSLPGLRDRCQTTLKPSASKDLPIICDSVTVLETYRGSTWKKNGDASGLTGKVKTKKPLLTQGDVCHYVTPGGPSGSFPLHGYQGRKKQLVIEIYKKLTKLTKILIQAKIRLTNRFTFKANISKLHNILKTRLTMKFRKLTSLLNNKFGSHYHFYLYSHFLIRFFSKCRQTSRFQYLQIERRVTGPINQEATL